MFSNLRATVPNCLNIRSRFPEPLAELPADYPEVFFVIIIIFFLCVCVLFTCLCVRYDFIIVVTITIGITIIYYYLSLLL